MDPRRKRFALALIVFAVWVGFLAALAVKTAYRPEARLTPPPPEAGAAP